MDIGQSFILAVKSLMASKMRALLTMLGIIIGVSAVILISGGRFSLPPTLYKGVFP